MKDSADSPTESQAFGRSIRSILALVLVLTVCISTLAFVAVQCWSFLQGKTESSELALSEGIMGMASFALGYYFGQKGSSSTTTTEPTVTTTTTKT